MNLRADGGPTAVGHQQRLRRNPAATATANRANARRWQREAFEPRDAAATDVATNDDVPAHDVHATTTTTSTPQARRSPKALRATLPHRETASTIIYSKARTRGLCHRPRRRHAGARADSVRRLSRSLERPWPDLVTPMTALISAQMHSHARPLMLLSHAACWRIAPRAACLLLLSYAAASDSPALWALMLRATRKSEYGAALFETSHSKPTHSGGVLSRHAMLTCTRGSHAHARTREHAREHTWEQSPAPTLSMVHRRHARTSGPQAVTPVL